MRYLVRTCLMMGVTVASAATEPPAPQVLVTDHGVQTAIAGPGAPAHVVGLERLSHSVVLGTGVKDYGLRYVVAKDDKRPGIAIPGEGYIGMSQPSDCNWYGGGFFDLQLNGESIGSTPIHSLSGRSTGGRGSVDFVFDHSVALVRVRFVALLGGDCLYTQVLLEPKQEITAVRLLTRCYPSGFISDSGARHVRTPVRDLAQGERADLDRQTECWTLYYDRTVDAGAVAPNGVHGVGPCALLWLPEQTQGATFTVGGYGIDTALTLVLARRDFRFVFLDYNGTRNAAAEADLRQRAPALHAELAEFAFTDPLAWPSGPWRRSRPRPNGHWPCCRRTRWRRHATSAGASRWRSSCGCCSRARPARFWPRRAWLGWSATGNAVCPSSDSRPC
jgi:hypothetical protein